MKRSWTTFALIIGLAALLGTLGVVQYRSLTRASAADGEKAKRLVKERVDHFAADFNREIQNAYFNFQTEPTDWRDRNWAAFNERYDFWREKTSYPELIAGFFFLGKSDGSLLKYDPQLRAFLPFESDAYIE